MGNFPDPLLTSDFAPVPIRVRNRKVFGQLVFLFLVLVSIGVGVLAGLVMVYSSGLPQVRELEDYRPDVITEIYADDGAPIGSFALERRVIVNYDQIPPVLRDAIVSIEDRHFESHWGVDVLRIIRAGVTDIFEWRKAQGASTLTQQLTRQLFLTPEKTWRRKFQEMLLAIQIERRFTKPQIFTMYVNLIPLGHGNFGFEAAAEFYFGKHLNDLTLPEAALLAGLPRTPPVYSPLLHPDRALARRNQVLAAMLDTGKIAAAEYRDAKAAPLGLNVHRWNNSPAPYFVEDLRQFLERKYGLETVHEKGLRVYTTLNVGYQRLAEQALRNGLRADDKRRGWRGAEINILKKTAPSQRTRQAALWGYTDDDWKRTLTPGSLVHGLVIDVKPDHALARFGDLVARLTPADFAWTGKRKADQVFAVGDVDLFFVKDLKGKTPLVILDQRPDVQGALVAIENSTGAIRAMVGGRDFEESKFNRARQAERQTGSSFKVYVYSQALIDGANPFDEIVDEPETFPSSSGPWSPHNYDFMYEGTITLLHALAESRNVPAVKLLAKIGFDPVIELCKKFGITSRLVPNLPLALGASDLTLLEHTSAFTAFPNDGVRVSPRTIDRVTNYDGRLVDEFPPEVNDVLPAPVARLMVSMLRETINSGTAVRAKAMAAQFPVAGKTGTTNDFTDAWFIGFSPSLTCGVWLGFDDHHSLGPKEEGAVVALPIWMEFMEAVLKERPREDFTNSPLLTTPEQVKQILASAGPEHLLGRPAKGSTSGGNPPAAPLAAQKVDPGLQSTPAATSKPPAPPPPATGSTNPNQPPAKPPPENKEN